MPNKISNSKNSSNDEFIPQDYNALIRRDRRILRNEEAVYRALNEFISTRRIDVRPNEICNAANVSRPTFYSYYSSCSDALKKYEAKLQSEFTSFIADHIKTESAFTLLLIFIYRRQNYFNACFSSQNVCLLTRFIRQTIAVTDVIHRDRIAHFTNVAAIEGIIYCWYEDGFNQASIKTYTNLINDSIKGYSHRHQRKSLT